MTLDQIINCVEREIEDHNCAKAEVDMQLAIYEVKKECYHDVSVMLRDIVSALRDLQKEQKKQECNCTPASPCDPRQ